MNSNEQILDTKMCFFRPVETMLVHERPVWQLLRFINQKRAFSKSDEKSAHHGLCVSFVHQKSSEARVAGSHRPHELSLRGRRGRPVCFTWTAVIEQQFVVSALRARPSVRALFLLKHRDVVVLVGFHLDRIRIIPSSLSQLERSDLCEGTVCDKTCWLRLFPSRGLPLEEPIKWPPSPFMLCLCPPLWLPRSLSLVRMQVLFSGKAPSVLRTGQRGIQEVEMCETEKGKTVPDRREGDRKHPPVFVFH